MTARAEPLVVAGERRMGTDRFRPDAAARRVVPQPVRQVAPSPAVFASATGKDQA